MPKTYHQCPECGRRQVIERRGFVMRNADDDAVFECLGKGCRYRVDLDPDAALQAIVHGMPPRISPPPA